VSNPYTPSATDGPPGAPPAPQWAAPPAPYQYPLTAPGRGGNGLAIAAVVMSGLSLLGVLVLAVLYVAGPVGDTGAPIGVLHGTATVAGGQANGDELASNLRQIVTDDGGDVEELTCPASSPVDAGEVTVCHGDVSGDEWAFIVVFEDADGTFVVNPI